jgi:uncharacterized protein (TIGR00251 family)
MHAFSIVLSRYAYGLRLTVKAKPGSSRTRPPRIVPLAGGGHAVEIAVAAPPEDGKANKALLAFLASAIGLKKSALSVKTGATGRFKVIEINGDDPMETESLVEKWLKSFM